MRNKYPFDNCSDGKRNQPVPTKQKFEREDEADDTDDSVTIEVEPEEE